MPMNSDMHFAMCYENKLLHHVLTILNLLFIPTTYEGENN